MSRDDSAPLSNTTVTASVDTTKPSTKSTASSTAVDADSRPTSQAVAPKPPVVDISPCIAGNLIWNLRVVRHGTISYVQNEPPVHTVAPNNDSTRSSSDPSSRSAAAEGFPHPTAPHAGHHAAEQQRQQQQRQKNNNNNNSATTTSGGKRCFLNFRGPYDKALWFLFMIQTCSHSNTVRLDDPQVGRRVTFDGCSPWKAPGYDLTTGHVFAGVHVEVNDLTSFYRLKVRVAAVEPNRLSIRSATRYVYPRLGYVQTPGWQPFAEPTPNDYVYDNAAVAVPSNHVTLISVVYLYVIRGNPRYFSTVRLSEVARRGSKVPRTVWSHDTTQEFIAPRPALLADAALFRVLLRGVPVFFFGGCRLLFSFHPPSMAPSRHHQRDLWNCSAPSWPDFHHHFLCNGKVECLGGQDETACPNTSCTQGGTLLYGTCYFFQTLSNRATWQDADTACKRLGAALASFPTVNSWYHFALLVQTERRGIFFGLQSVDDEFPHMSKRKGSNGPPQPYGQNGSCVSALRLLGHRNSRLMLWVNGPHESLLTPHGYRYLLKWTGGSVAYYYQYYTTRTRPYCGFVHESFSRLVSCGDSVYTSHRTRRQAFAALCHASPSSLSFSSGEKEKWQVGAAPLFNSLHILKLVDLRSAAGQFSWNRSSELNLVASISCPAGRLHRTHEFLACDAASECWLDYDVTSGGGGGGSDVTNTTTTATPTGLYGDHGETEMAVACSRTGSSSSSTSSSSSFQALFACKNGVAAVPYSLVCDFLQDCAENSDEDFCVFPPCSASTEYTCACGQCVPYDQRCDGPVQCVDETDEADCVSQTFQTYTYEFKPRPPKLSTFDGRGYIRFQSGVCPASHLLCPGDGYCLPVFIRCNGVYDCPGHEDEADCDSYRCPDYYRCRGKATVCLHPDHLCDGWPQCPQHDDERFCNLTCPTANCTCLGHAFTCVGDFDASPFSRLRYLDASGTGLEPGRLSGSSPMLVYLNLAGCRLTRLGNASLPNLLTLDLSDNRISAVDVLVLNRLKNLRNLSLARNPLSGLFSPRDLSSFSAPANEAILHVDLSGVDIRALDVRTYLPFPRLLSLNLSGSGVTRLLGDDGFRSMTSLSTLDLRGCPMAAFPEGVFEGLTGLQRVFAANYKLCCPENLPDGFHDDAAGSCQAPFNEVSSCESLLRSDVYRVCLYALAALALLGNSGCFCLRAFALAGRGKKTGFSVFVTHLCVSDFTMGVYLAVIGAADRAYLGRYLREDARWRRGAACQAAGFLALLSSEVSALIICLITLDRFLVIRFPFSRLRFAPFSAQVASLLAWTAGVALVTAPLLLPVMTSSGRFYGQTGICVPLPVTRRREGIAADAAAGDDDDRYAFGVMIVLNLAIFLLIAVGQVSVYKSMTSNAMSAVDSSRKSRDLIVARRLVTVVVTDFLCWFPLGLLGVLAARGVPIPGQVNVITAIFVLPLNSALNPFLYTLNVIQERRRRSAEEKLLKVIMSDEVMEKELVLKT